MDKHISDKAKANEHTHDNAKAGEDQPPCPPDEGSPLSYPERLQEKIAVVCPYCGSTETELFSLFGQQLLTVQYYCNSCRTPFEHIKDDDVLHDYAARKEGQL